MMQAMIFAAGLGTRFKPWTDEHPKALALVNGKSLLQRNIEYLQRFRIRRVVINVHHFADQVLEALRQANGWGSDIIISNESDSLLETGGGFLHAKDLFLPEQPILTCNVDILTNLDLARLQRFHEERHALISLAVTNRATSRYFLFGENDRLCGWQNTKTGEQRIAARAAGCQLKAYSGIAVFDPAIFSVIPFSGKFSLVELFLDLAPHQQILGFDHSGDVVADVGKPDSVATAEELFP
jgi:N-acetyl-alpha-D-muramate 1-phosphate uridylyltransferase